MDNTAIEYRITGVELYSKSMAPAISGLENTKLNFNVHVETKVDPHRKVILVFVKVAVGKEASTDILATVNTICVFDIVNFDAYITQNENQLFQIPDEIEFVIRPVAISTTRGIMYSEFRGTYLHGAILPIINMLHPPKN